jgi:hypothetical protein
MSNQRKSEFIGDLFICEVYGKVMAKFAKNLFYTRRYDLLEMLFQRPVKFSTVVAHKSLTDWSCLMDHRKVERVAFRNVIRDFRSFGQSESEN